MITESGRICAFHSKLPEDHPAGTTLQKLLLPHIARIQDGKEAWIHVSNLKLPELLNATWQVSLFAPHRHTLHAVVSQVQKAYLETVLPTWQSTKKKWW